MVAIRVATLADEPALRARLHEMPDDWPQFMFHDPMSWVLTSLVALRPEFQLVAMAGEEVAGYAHSAPVSWPHAIDALPAQGWDEMLGRALRATVGDRPPEMVSAFEINVSLAHRGTGVSAILLEAMRANALRRGFRDLVAPVRPNAKHREPELPMADYISRRREDGLPHDPWLRVHVRAGGRVVSVCPASMAIAGSLERWREWTGLTFDRDGPSVVPGALAPVEVSLAQDRAVYVEPNVWVHHALG